MNNTAPQGEIIAAGNPDAVAPAQEGEPTKGMIHMPAPREANAMIGNAATNPFFTTKVGDETWEGPTPWTVL